MSKHYVYMIVNNLNGKTYIGQHKYHETKLPENDGYMGSGKIIKIAEKKYGINNFTKKILHRDIEGQKQTDSLERYWISYYRLLGKAEYNICDGGGGTPGNVPWNKGKTFTLETRKKISKAHKGRKHSVHHNDSLKKKVLCIETNIVYESILSAENNTSIYKNNISLCCRGVRQTAGGFHWKYA